MLTRLADILRLQEAVRPQDLEKPRLLTSIDLRGIAGYIASGKAKRIVCLCGAGISVSAGIPDFRTPGTGLYSRLAEYRLPHPTAVFEIDFFRENPSPFFLLAKELFPGSYAPTPTHHFMKLLHDKGLLLRCYTQNIDSLEVLAGLPKHVVIPAHGNFDTARCIDCRAEHEMEHVKAAVMAQEPCYCTGQKSKGCTGLVKPDIVFFGENLPARFFSEYPVDLPAADLLIVLGTSLVVQPFASLLNYVGTNIPRLLINRERVGEGYRGIKQGFNFGDGNYRDAFYKGNCDDGVRELCRLLGWEQELDDLIKAWGRSAGPEEDAGLAVEPPPPELRN